MKIDDYRKRPRRRIRRAPSQGGPAGFSLPFEERKALQYLVNVANSGLMERKASEILMYAMRIVGGKRLERLVKERYSTDSEKEVFKLWLFQGDGDKGLSPEQCEIILDEDILPEVQARLRKLEEEGPTETDRRMSELARLFGLHAIEVEIVAFYMLWKTCLTVRSSFGPDSRCIGQYEESLRLKADGDVIFGVTRAAFVKAIENTTLFKAQIIEKDDCGDLSLSPWCLDYLLGLGSADLGRKFFTTENQEHLQLDDFDVSQDEMEVLSLILKRKAGANVFLYGAAGTGKTSFARSLAKRFGKQLLTVQSPEDDDMRDRMRAVYATINAADRKKALVLVDEADELLSSGQVFMSGMRASKSWINSLMDSHSKKVIWILNRSQSIDPSTMRRFAFTLEFKKADGRKRLRVLRSELEKRRGVNSLFTDEDLEGLCREFPVNAAGIVSALDVLGVNGRINRQTALRRVRTVLRNHEKAVGARPEAGDRKSLANYVLEGLNASVDLGNIVKAVMRQFGEGGAESSVSMLLHGLPGTGKTEFVNYLGQVLQRDVLLKRASDIQSKWVGETEKNIAEAFREARERGVILFFDEADSFLFPRAGAMHSWEKSHTNEILTQLENHRGVVVFATNDIDGLDHASLRRFGFKVRFDPLRPEGNVRLYHALLAPLLPEAPALSAAEKNRLEKMMNLTPGDFAVVRRQVQLLGTDCLTHVRLLDSLENEVTYKKGLGRTIGF